ncbi:hypothetical protein K7W42_22335 [Deinococcus sp. HMF7604]|uniref:hypothetical protein n=1 Tax=Deinococcus betulae TaxID=2873312 RepID=UPI001CCAE02E|nr:hypothetical protein [Deinococcus betulae]MBZ9753573.1 hypothetical protein [Deinococcus betulae]
MPYLLITYATTGEVLRRLGPFATAHAARTAAGEDAGQVLMWTREAETWQAEKWPQRYTVEADVHTDGPRACLEKESKLAL